MARVNSDQFPGPSKRRVATLYLSRIDRRTFPRSYERLKEGQPALAFFLFGLNPPNLPVLHVEPVRRSDKFLRRAGNLNLLTFRRRPRTMPPYLFWGSL